MSSSVRNLVSIAFAIFAFVTAGCSHNSLRTTRNSVAADVHPADQISGPLQGHVRLKLRQDAKPLNTGVFQPDAADTGCHDLDSATRYLGAIRISKLFGDGGRFAARRQSFGLHLWYDIIYDNSVPLDSAACILRNINCVEYVEFVYPVVPSPMTIDSSPISHASDSL